MTEGFHGEDIIKRYSHNPIITAAHYPAANTIFNSAVIRSDDHYHAVLRAELRDGNSCLVPAHSGDGIHFDIDEHPLRFPNCEPFKSHYTQHNYDPRLTEIDGVFYLAYAAGTPWGAAIGLASTKDFKSWKHYDLGSTARNRNAVLFPEKIKGKFARLERPFYNPHTDAAFIWYSESPDLEYWGHYRFVMGPHERWDHMKVGPGAPPIRTDEGWLLLYHGVRKTCSGFVYAMGACLLDLFEPWRVVRRPGPYLLQPEEPYERIGDVPNVIFPTSAVYRKECGDVWIYYGAADTCVALANATMSDLLEFCKKGP
jgi:beta-1,4-mannooligosaccharide/beta-1,4-mannosyl-N-acetylglucosamine phosphorylase